MSRYRNLSALLYLMLLFCCHNQQDSEEYGIEFSDNKNVLKIAESQKVESDLDGHCTTLAEQMPGIEFPDFANKLQCYSLITNQAQAKKYDLIAVVSMNRENELGQIFASIRLDEWSEGKRRVHANAGEFRIGQRAADGVLKPAEISSKLINRITLLLNK